MPSKYNLSIVVVAAVLAGCTKPSDFELASRAISEHKTNDLVLILARNKGAVTNVLGFDGSTLMHHAMINIPDIECAKLLVEAGADVNQADRTGATPLHLVCACGARLEAVSFLLEHGARVNPRNGAGETPLGYSRKWSRNKEGVDMLVKHGATE